MDRQEIIQYWQFRTGDMSPEKPFSFTHSDLNAIADLTQVKDFSPGYLPGRLVVQSDAAKRHSAINHLAQQIWQKDPKYWLDKENSWLSEARKLSGSTRTEGKDRYEDLVTPEIMVRLLAAARIFVTGSPSRKHYALSGLNLFIGEVTLKGLARIDFENGKSLFTLMKDAGLSLSSMSKYLPNPKDSLWQIIAFMVDKQNIASQVYH